ncbi:DUF4307 domain-containing protein [Gordonia sp. HNM0687]|uniref:DUF4307 domain-containing protein n=1 Tax=Gordonia mangrovi TaxID=2665643 RepID=A0A6L7GSK7_9ACTN|nr:DUF4307 domain-containing protein [Gordonia mangrovi]MXP22984.1 DUF4307 domain-containing protein [Gordonia mangrovi]UVF77280.1 DUF4307 domain-containing protein [Gordonia mangrovi]
MNSSVGGTGAGDGEGPRSGPRATYPAAQSARSRRNWFIALSVLVVAAGIGLAVLGYSRFASPDVSGEATGYDIVDQSTVVVQFTVTRADPGRPVACVVRGRSIDGDETGRREILIPAGSQTQVGIRTEVATSKPPVIGEVFGCTADVPAYLTESTP